MGRGGGCSTCICEVCVYVCGLCERHLSLRVCAFCLLNERKDVFICESCYLYTLSLQVDVGNQNSREWISSWERLMSKRNLECCPFLQTVSFCMKELEMIHGGWEWCCFSGESEAST